MGRLTETEGNVESGKEDGQSGGRHQRQLPLLSERNHKAGDQHRNCLNQATYLFRNSVFDSVHVGRDARRDASERARINVCNVLSDHRLNELLPKRPSGPNTRNTKA